VIYLVRHGQAAASWGEHPDPGLSELGHRQAAERAEALLGLGIENVISSPMQRCRETAEAFVRMTDHTARIEPFVSEIPTPDEVENRVSWLQGMMAGHWADVHPLVQDWRSNLLSCISELPDQTVVFSHFVAINAIVAELEGRPDVMVFRPTYCSLTELKKVGGELSLKARGAEAETKVL